MDRGKFLKVVCPRCRHRQVVFGKSGIKVKCLGCKYMLVRTTGGKAQVRARVKEVLWN